ncbi:putative membrane protein YeiH [Spinactinospora alkalitolerans]|uniref:Putative membrane protein YeiH n=1 Tax=Spinactinospora alkalitolerans TaxID=687207 RepID=A0A852TVE7_9ACTN|nr:TRIC cation channel family protein [Spinactinospora alkalitolerans]NYE47671.1 putative membrane protein YeiH [Spinactinospora alkalitolerans]
MSATTLLLVLDLAGVFAFALDGALTGIRSARIDIVGAIVLGLTTAMGGGIIRDLLLGVTPATFQDWRYIAVALAGALLAFFLNRVLERLAMPIALLDAAGLSLFCVIGATKALEYGFGPVQATILGAVTGVGGGTLRDVLINRLPTVLSRDSDIYATPALLGAAIVVLAAAAGGQGAWAAVLAAAVCFTVRVVALRYRWNAPGPPGTRPSGAEDRY